MSEHQKTLKMVINLDRTAIEKRLGALQSIAQAAGLVEVVALLDGCAGASRTQLEQKIRDAQKALSGLAGHAELKAQLDLVELNLPNL
jgi:hypothetical protein